MHKFGAIGPTTQLTGNPITAKVPAPSSATTRYTKLAFPLQSPAFVELPYRTTEHSPLLTDSASLIGQTFSHYRIIEKLGGGGMVFVGIIDLFKASRKLNRGEALGVAVIFFVLMPTFALWARRLPATDGKNNGN